MIQQLGFTQRVHRGSVIFFASIGIVRAFLRTLARHDL
jgi:hypothetical protein